MLIINIDNKMPKVYINDVQIGKLNNDDKISCIKYQEGMIQVNETLEAASHIKENIKFVSNSKIYSMNSLIMATHISFDKHVPLILGPDIIWNTIMQGISKHINENSEEFRDILVTHKEQKIINIERNDLKIGDTNNKWQEITKEFIKKIIDNCNNDALNKAINLRFSTTTPIQDAVHDMTFMDVVKSYFKYKVTTRCGIPYIDIDGTVEDWINIRESLDILDDLNLTSWKEKLQNVINHFIEIYSDVNDKDFWNNIYLLHGAKGSGSVTTVSGWISDLFLYINEKKIDYTLETRLRYQPSKFPYALTNTPFIWEYYGKNLNMKFVSGIIGIKIVDESINSITPELGWQVINMEN